MQIISDSAKLVAVRLSVRQKKQSLTLSCPDFIYDSKKIIDAVFVTSKCNAM